MLSENDLVLSGPKTHNASYNQQQLAVNKTKALGEGTTPHHSHHLPTPEKN